jgi:hypothetical protein
MSIDTIVVPLDPVSPHELFDAAREAAENPGSWTLHDGPEFGAVPMYQTRGNPHAEARVSVHFPAAGGPYPREQGSGAPDGYARVGFCTGAYTNDTDALWRHHAGLVRQLGQWLDARGIRWAWEFEDDPWIFGAVPAARGARR